MTQGEKSLRDLLQWMNLHYAKQHLFFPDSQGVEQAAEAITGKSFAEFCRDYVSGVEEIPYDDFFQFVGLRAVNQTVPAGSAGFTTTANLGAQPEVVQVDPNSDAYRAGIAAGDRVIAIDGEPANASLDDQLAQMLPGTTVHLRMENRKGQRDVKLRLGLREQQAYKLQDVPSVSQEQRAHRMAWIHGDDESRGTP
jgi:predicted metalloprotease with PDZ domain